MYHWSLGGSKKLPISHLQIMGFFPTNFKGNCTLKTCLTNVEFAYYR